MDSEIIEFLRREGRPQIALQVSKGVGKVTASDVNPTLYQLLEEGRVQQMGTEGRAPLWGLAQSDSSHGNQGLEHFVSRDPSAHRPVSAGEGKPTAHSKTGTSAISTTQSTNAAIGEITDEVGRLSIELWKGSLNKHHQELRTGIIVRYFLPELYKLPLTEIECAQIRGNPDDMAQVDELITILKTKTKEHFDMFCSVLEGNGYKHWANKLKGLTTLASTTAHVQEQQTAEATPLAVPAQHVLAEDTMPKPPATVQKDAFAKLRKRNQRGDKLLRILVVGEPGSGKSTLIQNIFGVKLKGKRGELREYPISVDGCPLVLYISYGAGEDTHKHFKTIQKLVHGGSLSLIIYCLPMNDTRLRSRFFDTVKKHSEIGVNWDRFLLAFTFADMLPVPRQQRELAAFDCGTFFMKKMEDWVSEIKRHLLEKAVLSESAFSAIRIHSLTGDSTELLPNGRDWYGQFWDDILDILLPKTTNMTL